MTDKRELDSEAGTTPAPKRTSSVKISDKNGFIRTLSTLENEVHELRKAIREEGTSSATPTTASVTEPVTASNGPCWEGYKQIGMKKGKGGKMVPNCVPVGTADDSPEDAEFAKKRTKAQTPAPKKDRIKGSSKNKKGSASGGKKINFSKSVEKSLQNKANDHNKTAPKGRRATLGMLKAAYRRGAGAFSVSHRPGQSRVGWAMARVNAFLRLLKSGKPSKAAYTQDNDLLPASHPRSTKKKAAVSSMTASALIPEERDLAEAIYEVVQKHGKFDQDGDGVWAGYTPAAENEDASIGVKCSNCVFYQGGDQCAIIALPVEPEGKCRFAMLPEGAVKGYDIPLRDPSSMELLLASAYADSQLLVDLPAKNTFETIDEAVLAATEYSDLGYEVEPAFRASWLRAVRNGEEPYKRIKMLATLKYDSLDSDLLPREGFTDE